MWGSFFSNFLATSTQLVLSIFFLMTYCSVNISRFDIYLPRWSGVCQGPLHQLRGLLSLKLFCQMLTMKIKDISYKKIISNESVFINSSVHIMNSHSIGIINPCNDKLTKQLNDGYKWITISFLDFFFSNTLRCVCVWTYISHFGVYLHGWLVLFQGSDHLLVKLVPSLLWKMLKWKQLSYKPHCKWFFQATRWWHVRSGHTTRKWILISLGTLIALLFADF